MRLVIKWALAGAAACAGVPTAASAAIFLAPAVAYGGFNSVDGAGYTPNSRATQTTIGQVKQPINPVNGVPTGIRTTDYRSVVEFDLRSLPTNINVTAAKLTFNVTTTGNVGVVPYTLIGSTYAGDGVASASDLTASGTPFSFPMLLNSHPQYSM